MMGFLSHQSIFCPSGARVTNRIKKLYFESAIRQEFAYYDTSGGSGHLSSLLSEQSAILFDAVGTKAARFLQFLATGITGFVIGKFQSQKASYVLKFIVSLKTTSKATCVPFDF